MNNLKGQHFVSDINLQTVKLCVQNVGKLDKLTQHFAEQGTSSHTSILVLFSYELVRHKAMHSETQSA